MALQTKTTRWNYSLKLQPETTRWNYTLRVEGGVREGGNQGATSQSFSFTLIVIDCNCVSILTTKKTDWRENPAQKNPDRCYGRVRFFSSAPEIPAQSCVVKVLVHSNCSRRACDLGNRCFLFINMCQTAPYCPLVLSFISEDVHKPCSKLPQDSLDYIRACGHTLFLTHYLVH